MDSVLDRPHETRNQTEDKLVGKVGPPFNFKVPVSTNPGHIHQTWCLGSMVCTRRWLYVKKESRILTGNRICWSKLVIGEREQCPLMASRRDDCCKLKETSKMRRVMMDPLLKVAHAI